MNPKHQEQGNMIWEDAIKEVNEQKIRSILIRLTDAIGYKGIKVEEDAFNDAHRELLKLINNI